MVDDKAPIPNADTYNALIEGWVRGPPQPAYNSVAEASDNLFNDMNHKEIPKNERSYALMLEAYLKSPNYSVRYAGRGSMHVW